MIHRTYQFISHQIKQKQTASVPFTIAAVSVICVYIYIYRIEHIHTVYIHIPHASTCHNHLNSLLRQVTSAWSRSWKLCACSSRSFSWTDSGILATSRWRLGPLSSQMGSYNKLQQSGWLAGCKSCRSWPHILKPKNCNDSNVWLPIKNDGQNSIMGFVKNWNRVQQPPMIPAKDESSESCNCELPTLHGSPPAAKLLLPFLQASFWGVERNIYTIMKMIKAIHDAIHKTGL